MISRFKAMSDSTTCLVKCEGNYSKLPRSEAEKSFHTCTGLPIDHDTHMQGRPVQAGKQSGQSVYLTTCMRPHSSHLNPMPAPEPPYTPRTPCFNLRNTFIRYLLVLLDASIPARFSHYHTTFFPGCYNTPKCHTPSKRRLLG